MSSLSLVPPQKPWTQFPYSQVQRPFSPTTYPLFAHVISQSVKVVQSCLTLCDPMDYIFHGILQARILKWVAFSFSRGSPQPRDQTQVSLIAGWFFTVWATREAQEHWSPSLQADSLLSEPPGKPKNTGVGSLSLLQGIFPTQEWNWDFRHCRQVLYCLSHQEVFL